MPSRFRTRLVSLALLSAWCATPGAEVPAGRAFTAAEALFRQDPRWLGSDGAVSAPLGDGRIFFSFDDTFIATSDEPSREASTMVRNSIAILDGNDPLAGRMSFHWGHHEDGSPASFFPEDGAAWYWTGDAIRLGSGPLIVFLFRIVDSPGRDPGFRHDGFALAVVNNPAEPPDRWQPVIHRGALPGFDAVPGSALIPDGEHVIALAIREHGAHAATFARYRAMDLARGDSSRAEWWAGDALGWVAESQLGPAGPVFEIEDAGAECSIHYEGRLGAWVHVAAYGFGAAHIGMRIAPALTGPWSTPVKVYDPPELQAPRPFVYAAMAHPELQAPDPDAVVVTYATNAWEYEDLFSVFGGRNLYWPRVITVSLTGSGD